jgi:succinate dehydrogenase / fumarate reductase, flavoprotein subunit
MRALQTMMQKLVGIYRIEADLDAALIELAELRRRWTAVCIDGGRAYNPGWNTVFELGNLLTVSEAITRSARQRTESRGAHSRLDFPDTDDETWGHRNSVIAKGADGRMTVHTAPVLDMEAGLQALLAADHR